MRTLMRTLMGNASAKMLAIGMVGLIAALAANASISHLRASEGGEPSLSSGELLAILQSLPDGSEHQRSALSDGRVTIAELDQAASLWAACVEGTGAAIPRVYPSDGLRPPRFSVEISAPNPEAPPSAEARAAVDNCRALHLDAVQTVWSGQLPPPNEGGVAGQIARLEECIHGGGVPTQSVEGPLLFDGSRSFEVEDGNVDAYVQCALVEHALSGARPPRPEVRED